MIFIGHKEGSKQCRAYDPLTCSIHLSRNVVFEEESKWKWETPGEEMRSLTTFFSDSRVDQVHEGRVNCMLRLTKQLRMMMRYAIFMKRNQSQ